MERYPIEQEGLAFKNLLSGPATPGRILNYLRLSGEGKLRHQTGYRYTDLAGGVGSAWTTEFMRGLGLVCADERGNGAPVPLMLTARGARVYALLEGTESTFSESHDAARTQREMARCAGGLLDALREVCLCSWPFRILRDYLDAHGTRYPDRAAFLVAFLDEVKSAYGGGEGAPQATAANRVPSLLQLCEVFGLLCDGSDGLRFDRAAFDRALDEAAAAREDDLALQDDLRTSGQTLEGLAARYGADGNELREVLMRNHTLQRRFREGLLREQDGRCALCGLDVADALIASHIRPAARCGVYDKLDRNNGLLLCANHDRLFDRQLISFTPEGALLISRALSGPQRAAMGLKEGGRLSPALLTERRCALLREHRVGFLALEEERADG